MFDVNALYTGLMQLVEKDNLFFSKDFSLDDITYRVFSYHVSTHAEFCQPFALECRGVMFDISNLDSPKLVSLPMRKFFNYNEFPPSAKNLAQILVEQGRLSQEVFDSVDGKNDNSPLSLDREFDFAVSAQGFDSLYNFFPHVQTPDFTDCLIMDKADGSLISTYLHQNEIKLKSKTSLESDQAMMASIFLNKKENALFKNELYQLCKDGTKTVNMELVSPLNRIVVEYPTTDLIVLNVRDHITGNLLHKNDIDVNLYPTIHNKWVEYITPTDFTTWMSEIKNMEGIEGFIIKLKNQELLKIKIPWYINLHGLLTDIMNDKHLFDCALKGDVDDLKGYFVYDSYIINRIELFEEFTRKLILEYSIKIDNFHEEHKHLSRKEYAIAGNIELDKISFSVAMGKYTNKPIELISLLSKNKDKFLPKIQDQK